MFIILIFILNKVLVKCEHLNVLLPTLFLCGDPQVLDLVCTMSRKMAFVSIQPLRSFLSTASVIERVLILKNMRSTASVVLRTTMLLSLSYAFCIKKM